MKNLFKPQKSNACFLTIGTVLKDRTIAQLKVYEQNYNAMKLT